MDTRHMLAGEWASAKLSCISANVACDAQTSARLTNVRYWPILGGVSISLTGLCNP